jgi:carbon storage regulator CsrA
MYPFHPARPQPPTFQFTLNQHNRRQSRNWYRLDAREDGIIWFRLRSWLRGVNAIRQGGFLMLVLGRRKHQSVVIGDEITLTVEEICDSGDGQRIFGATVRLGFQTPQDISICRSELRAKRRGAAHAGGAAQRLQPRTGKLVELSDAQVRLRIQVPRKVPVCHNGTPTIGLDPEEGFDGETGGRKAVHHVTCQKNDRIAICHNITIAALDFRRLVSSEPDP